MPSPVASRQRQRQEANKLSWNQRAARGFLMATHTQPTETVDRQLNGFGARALFRRRNRIGARRRRSSPHLASPLPRSLPAFVLLFARLEASAVNRLNAESNLMALIAESISIFLAAAAETKARTIDYGHSEHSKPIHPKCVLTSSFIVAALIKRQSE